MEESMNDMQLFLWFGLIFFGLAATVVYYFARYYFRTHEQDSEVVERLKESPPSFQEEIQRKETETVEEKEPISPPPKKELKEALANTRASLFGRIREALGGSGHISSSDMEALEEILYTSDLGPTTVQRLLDSVEERLEKSEKSDVHRLREALREEMLSIFEAQKAEDSGSQDLPPLIQKVDGTPKPVVWMVVGVNGAGKTTTIGKLAHRMAARGKKVLVVAGDTFRAAAGDQLKVWSERAEVEIFSPEGVTDPSAVAFDGVQMAKAQGFDLVIVDTAGRLHTQTNLMEELKKMKRVLPKVLADAPHETLLVLDANSGQNALVQAKTFHEALGLTGVVLTKMDGTAKGGVAVGVAYELRVPIKLIGVGEGIEDLRGFQSVEFVESII